MAEIIDGKKIAANVKAEVRAEVEKLKAAGAKPGLAVVLVGNNPASRVYVSNKEKDCAECGFASYEYALPEETTEAELLELVEKLNSDETVDGILVQLPLPKQICEQTILHAISPEKDVDAFHPENVGRIMIGDYRFLPCTPAGVIEMLDAMQIDVSGKHCVVIGRSNIVGKPMGMLLLHRNGTVTICHSRTKDLAEQTKQADILVAAVGRAGFVTKDMVKPGAVVIDVGMNRNAEGKLVGDVCYDEVAEIASAITPVPGGVGPMTRAILMRNTLTAAKAHRASLD
ncbi:MAG: bifunctional methylenetetrahydrofolate dehydrogenase/methenyltetrahydrofolate cyclohydrolase FolD [Oscillospiraceae bacterium]|nr:bifunctional methylenetetrahydrofolate dehydrogenase/methenyltetrahydrofolate cyclohydrolase FolD [Oscillospiraceae bacterium]